MLELAARYKKQVPVSVNVICEEHGIPPRFLVQILHELREAGYVESFRGAAGGYRLAVDPKEIAISEVIKVFREEDDHEGRCNSTKLACSLDGVFFTANQKLESYLGGMTLARVAKAG
jgi:Rrf2 family protein